jgi:two-component system, chemotaxis family, protein-glutamate methylesterase/glutaminase
VPQDVEIEVQIAREDNPIDVGLGHIAQPSPFSCPECHGVLLRLKAADPMRFRCHTGHAYSADSLIAAINEGIESSLWTAMRALQEGGLVLEHVAAHLQERSGSDAAAILTDQVASAQRQAELIRKLVTERAGLMTSVEVPAGK